MTDQKRLHGIKSTAVKLHKQSNSLTIVLINIVLN